MPSFPPKPPWLKVRAPGGETFHQLQGLLRSLDLHTVCEEARCPNMGECWREGTATVMLLGDVCTRGCRFCAVTTGRPAAPDEREPDHVAEAIGRMALQYVVLTMVDRDDLPDGGAGHVARTVRRLRELRADILIETLVGDFQGKSELIDQVVDAEPDVFAHNVEVVRRVTRRVRDVRCGYDRSFDVLRRAKERAPGRLTKSSLMVGIGETDDEVLDSLRDLRGAGVDIVTIGQYLRPGPKYHEVVRYVTPEQFAVYEKAAGEMGFLYAASGPLVRSSYKAAEVFVRSALRPGQGESVESMLADRLDRARRESEKVNAELASSRQGEGGAYEPSASELFARSAVSMLREGATHGALVPAAALLSKHRAG